MMGHKICFRGEIRLIITKLSQLLLLICSTAYISISFRASAQARCTLLELMECYNRGWKELPNDVTRFYCDIMMDIITD